MTERFFVCFLPDVFQRFFQKNPKKFISNAEIARDLQLNLVKLQESCKLEYNIVSQPQRGDCAFRQGGRKRRVSMRNAKQSIRRTVAGLLAGAMLLGMTPLAAFAEGSSSASGDWQFKAFGTSTAAGVNTIADGADINGKVTLNSCTIKDDGTIDKKGGKFVADSPADGLSFYYTTIDPTTQNFYLQADVTIDYVNPAPDGQEGFALLAHYKTVLSVKEEKIGE